VRVVYSDSLYSTGPSTLYVGDALTNCFGELHAMIVVPRSDDVRPLGDEAVLQGDGNFVVYESGGIGE
jgi:hypothetical protein